MDVAAATKAVVLVLLAALFQVTLFASLDVAGGSPDVLLLVLVGVALLRGPVFGAAGGFFGGLVVDTATLSTLGLTSLVLTVAGYWVGRYGETSGRDRTHAPLVAAPVVTALCAAGAFALHFVLGNVVTFRELGESLLPALAFNTLLAAPVFALCRTLLAPGERADARREATLLG